MSEEMMTTETTETAEVQNEGGETVTQSHEEELEACRAEIRRLSTVVEQYEQTAREEKAFAELYPNMSMADIPDIVRESAAKNHLPLIAEYALYARRLEVEHERDVARLEAAVSRSSGAIEHGGEREELFSIEQIRMMTPREVKKHYKAVMRSLAGSKSKN